MKLSFVIGIYLTNIVMRSSVGFEHDDVVVLLTLLVFWAWYMRYIRNLHGSKSTIGPFTGRSTPVTRPVTTTVTTPVTTPSTTPSTTTPVTEPLLGCVPTYTLYEGPGRRFCYRYVNECRSQDNARLACRREGANLAIIDDQSLPAFAELIKVYLQTNPRICSPTFGIWLDAKTRVGDFVAEYRDGTTISSENPLWQAGYPFIGKQCVEYATDVNDQRIIRINHAPCEFAAAYVCQLGR